MSDANFTCPDLTAFAGHYGLGLEVVGQRLVSMSTSGVTPAGATSTPP